MKIDEALYQLKQNIKMHEIEGTTSNKNEREKALLDYITNLQEENEMYKNIIDELILTGLASSITKEDFEYMWKVAYNKEYNPNDIKEIAERHGIIKGE